MSDWTETQIEQQDAVSELREIATRIDAELSCAESAEAVSDFEASIEEAIDAAEELLKELREMREALRKVPGKDADR